MFLIKKIMAPFFMPLSVVLLLSLVGLFCLWFTRKEKAGKVFATVAFGLLALLSYDPISDLLAGPLEKTYPPIMNAESVEGIRWIVVLGGGSEVDGALPSSTYLCEASLRRLDEGVRLHKRIPDSKVVITGASGFSGIIPVAQVMADATREWGVKAEDMVVETQSRDTEDHAVFVQEIVGQDRFLLITSASHMPRAVALFRARGMEPIPAPTDYMSVEREGGLRPDCFFPSAGALVKAERALHEYLGLMWARVRGQM
jgi:uncharacterized SAM-binding protein YcdF (DUF218 family)